MNLAEKTRDELVKIAMDLRDEANGWADEAETLRRKLNAKVDRMGANKPWKLACVFFLVGTAFGALVF